MTGRARLQGFDLPFLDHFSAVQLLKPGVFFGVGTPFPIQVGNVIGRPQLCRWISVAIQAESHAQGLVMINLVHVINWPVAFHTTNPPVDVHRMVEIDEVGHTMDLDPGDGFSAGGTLAYQGQARVFLEYLVWQFMQTELAGMFEYQDFSTALWQ